MLRRLWKSDSALQLSCSVVAVRKGIKKVAQLLGWLPASAVDVGQRFVKLQPSRPSGLVLLRFARKVYFEVY